MTMTPEYGEEQLIEEREDEVAESARGSLPRWEDLGDAEVAEQLQAEEESHHPALENHEARQPGATCDRCGTVFEEIDDVRRTVDGRWVHEICPEARQPHPDGDDSSDQSLSVNQAG